MVGVASLAVEGYLNAVAWNADGSRLAALSGFGNQLTIWDSRGWTVDSRFPRYGGAYSGNSLAFLGDESLLLPAPMGRSPDPPHRELFLTSFEQIDATTGKRIRYVEDKFYDRGRRRIMECFSVARGALVAGIPSGNPNLISLFQAKPLQAEPWKLLKNFEVSEDDRRHGFARSLALSTSGSLLAVGTVNGHVKTFDTTTGYPLLDRDLSGEGSYPISVVAFSRDGRYLAVGRARGYGGGSNGRMLRILEAETLEDTGLGPTTTYDDLYAISWGPNDEIALAASNLMEVGQLGADGTFDSFGTQPGRDFYSVAFSPRGHLAAAKGSTVLVYEY